MGVADETLLDELNDEPGVLLEIAGADETASIEEVAGTEETAREDEVSGATDVEPAVAEDTTEETAEDMGARLLEELELELGTMTGPIPLIETELLKGMEVAVETSAGDDELTPPAGLLLTGIGTIGLRELVATELTTGTVEDEAMEIIEEEAEDEVGELVMEVVNASMEDVASDGLDDAKETTGGKMDDTAELKAMECI